MNNGAFTPSGSTVLVGTTPLQVSANSNTTPTSYRVRNTGTNVAYFAWYPAIGTSTPTFSAAAPTAGVPSPNTIGLSGSATEKLSLPPNCWFVASNGATIEVTPGEGF